MMPVARRILGENNELTLRMRVELREALYKDPAATLDDLREAVTTLEDTERIARRVLGGAHPNTTGIGLRALTRNARATLRSREAPGGARKTQGHRLQDRERPPRGLIP